MTAARKARACPLYTLAWRDWQAYTLTTTTQQAQISSASVPCARLAHFSSCGVELVDQLFLLEVQAQLGHHEEETVLAEAQVLDVGGVECFGGERC